MDEFDKLVKSLKYSYFKKEKDEFKSLGERNSKNLLDVINVIKKKNKIVYRGFSKKYIDNDFWKWIFDVGDKGGFFREKTLGRINYASNHDETAKENYYNLLSELQNDILPNYKHKNRVQDIDTFKDRIEEYRVKKKIDYREMYYLILIWLHNIGACTGHKNESPFVSTSTSLDIAFRFNDRYSTTKYAFVVILSDAKIADYFYTKRLNEILKKLNIDWFKDCNKEVMFKDAIFPQLIVGILEKKGDNANFIINPYLLRVLESEISNSYKAELLIKFGIFVDQKSFEKGLKDLKYNGYVEQKQDERKICKDDSSFNISTIKGSKIERGD